MLNLNPFVNVWQVCDNATFLIKPIIIMQCIKSWLFLQLACISFFASATVIEHFESIKSDRKALYTFFKSMPKGGELHYHFDGSSPAETMLALADRGKYCLNPTTQRFKRFKTICHGITAQQLLNDKTRYEQIVRAWSMKNFKPGRESRLEHFFSVFSKEETIQSDFNKQLLADILQRASDQNELYLEIIAFHLKNASKYAQLIHSSQNMLDKKRILLSNSDFKKSIRRSISASNRLINQSRQILGCNRMAPKAACSLTVKFQYFVNREEPPDQIFAQALAGFSAAAQSDNIVGINLVEGENGIISLRDYKAQMQIFQFMHALYPTVHISLHAGELTPSIVKPEQLEFHIHDAVFTGKAERIGHGVDIAHEKNHCALLKHMAEKPVAVEINLTSNRKLLTVYGERHPLRLYLKHQVPIVLSTDDEGILRTDLTSQYVDAVKTYKLDYPTIKTINRNALTYSFLPGSSLWSDAARHILVPACSHLSSASCMRFIQDNIKAKLQWNLEKKLSVFESMYH